MSMFRSLSVILGASVLLTACGGGGGGGAGGKSSAVETSSSSSVVSVSSSSLAAVSSSSSVQAVSSSVVSSSTVSSAAPDLETIDLPATSWYGEKDAGVSNGVVAVTAAWQGAGYYLNQPIPTLEFATIEVTVVVDNAFKTSGSGLSLWAVVDADPWPGKADCSAVESSALVEGVEAKVTCVLNSGGVFAQTVSPVKLGIQATSTPAGTFTIKSARILLTKESDFSSSSSSSSSVEASASSADVSSSVASSAVSSSSVASSASSADSSSSVASSVASSQVRIEMDGSWYAEGSSTVTWVGSEQSVVPTARWAGAGYYMDAPAVSLENATVNVVVNVDAAFKNSGAGLQIWASVVGDSNTTGCPWVMNANLVAGQDVTVSCTLNYNWFNQTSAAVKFGLQVEEAVPAGGFLIKDAYLVLP